MTALGLKQAEAELRIERLRAGCRTLGLTGVAARALARVLPQDETSAIELDELKKSLGGLDAVADAGEEKDGMTRAKASVERYAAGFHAMVTAGTTGGVSSPADLNKLIAPVKEEIRSVIASRNPSKSRASTGSIVSSGSSIGAPAGPASRAAPAPRPASARARWRSTTRRRAS